MGSTLEALKALLATRGAKIALGIVGGAVVLSVGSSVWFVSNARSTHCEIQSHDPLSIKQLIAVKKRFTAYKRSPGSGLTLSGAELSMLLEDRADVPVYIDVQGQHMRAQVAVPATNDRCYPIDFEGDISVENGVAYVTPDKLTIGEVDLSSLAHGVRLELLPENMPTTKSALFLRQTRSASVHGGEMHVELHAPKEFSLQAE